jgi:hypothetical protein
MSDHPEAENSGAQPPADGESSSGGVLPHASGAGDPVGGVLYPTSSAAEPPAADEPLVPEWGAPSPDPEPPAYELPAARTELPPAPSYPSYINPDAGLAPADDPAEDDLPLPKGRSPASTRYLSMALLIAVAFGGGVAAQKHHDKGYTPPISGAQAAMAAGLAGGGAGGGGGAAAAAAGGGAPGTLTFTPKTGGTITDVSGGDITVLGPDGVKHLIHTNAQTVVLRKGNVADLKPGTQMAADGTPDDAGVVTAKGIIAQ